MIDNPIEYVFTASGELCESTYGTFEEAYDDLTRYESWGVILKHIPYSFDDNDRPFEEVVYEHCAHLKR